MEQTINTRNHELIAKSYTRYYNELKMYLVSYTHDVMAAEDMLQDLFIKLMSLDMLTAETIRNLIFVMAKRMIIDDARHKMFVRQSERMLIQVLKSYDNVSPAVQLQAKEVAENERTILSRMAKKRAHVYELYRHEELSASEIAQRLGISQRTVEAHIYNATKEMRAEMRKVI